MFRLFWYKDSLYRIKLQGKVPGIVKETFRRIQQLDGPETSNRVDSHWTYEETEKRLVR